VLWRQHYPCDLLVDDTLKTLLTQHAGAAVTLQCDWDALNNKHAIIALGLGAAGNRASFYDFVVWLVDSGNAVLTYDPAAGKYVIAAKKTSAGQATKLDPLDVAGCRVVLPELRRELPQVLNGYSENPQLLISVEKLPGIRGKQR